MMLRTREIPNNTPEQVLDYLTSALVLVEQLDPPSDLREIVFEKACDLYSGKQIVAEQQQMHANGLGLLR